MSTHAHAGTTPRHRLAAVLVCATVLTAACGDDGDDSTGAAQAVTTNTEDAASEYCALIEEIGDELPTGEQFDQILAAAPAEIADNLAVVVDSVRENGTDAFNDPAVVENFPAIDQYERETCEGEVAAVVDADAHLIEVAATEYAFDFEDPEAGPVSFVISNDGHEVHEMSLVRFVGDATFDEAVAAEDPEADGLIETVGFAGPIAPGGEIVLNADLEPGRYIVICFVPGPDGTPHVESGMLREFTVD